MADNCLPLGMNMMTKVMAAQATNPQATHTSPPWSPPAETSPAAIHSAKMQTVKNMVSPMYIASR